MLEIGSTLGGMYSVLADVARGGTSHVYLVLNSRAGKQWAAKEVAKKKSEEDGMIRGGLITDAEILMKLRHPNIPSIVDVIETDEFYYILMDYIEGITLKDVMIRDGKQTQENVVKWGMQLCDVFSYLHGQEPKIIYRDTKPANIMLRPSGDVVLIDFGAAREYKTGKVEDTSALGSRGYAAPEQYGGMGQTDERTDIYNLGATLYHLVTGHNPTQYPYNMYPIRHWDRQLSSGLEKIILKCTRSNPDERYQSAAELKHDLERYRELDDDVRRKKARKIIAGGICLAASGLCLAGGLMLNSAAKSLQEASYSDILKKAEYATTKDAQIDLYHQAITLDPARPDAYSDLLENVMLPDNDFDKDEADALTAILADTTGNRTNESRFAETPEYDEFCYNLGLAYFYYYNGNGNKPMARPWLETAAESSVLNEYQKSRASRLAVIAEYYQKLGRKNLAGDAEVSYAQYWRDMDSLTNENIVLNDNAKTAIVSYREIVYQIQIHSLEFRKAGIEEDVLKAKLDDIMEHLESDMTPDDNDIYAEEIGDIKTMIEKAGDAIETAYHGKEG